MSFVHVVLVWGSNNLTAAYRKNHVFSAQEIYQRTVGSKLTVINRLFYNTYIWLQKCVVMILYKRMLAGLPWADKCMKLYWAILAATYVVIQVVTFTDCRPLHLYWQVVPNPGTCSQALGQLIILGALNIVTDLMLIILPMPTLWSIQRSLVERLRLVGLFSIGFFLVAITVVRLPLNFANGTAQVNRTTWASVESFGAAFVANVPTLFTLRRKTLNLSSGTRTGATSGSNVRTRTTRTGDFSSRDGWRQMGSKSEVNAEDESDKGILVDMESDRGITVTRSIELVEVNANGKNVSR
jgi:hypothetical protein